MRAPPFLCRSYGRGCGIFLCGSHMCPVVPVISVVALAPVLGGSGVAAGVRRFGSCASGCVPAVPFVSVVSAVPAVPVVSAVPAVPFAGQTKEPDFLF